MNAATEAGAVKVIAKRSHAARQQLREGSVRIQETVLAAAQ